MSEVIYERDYAQPENLEGLRFRLVEKPEPPRELVPYAEQNLKYVREACDQIAIKNRGSIRVTMHREERRVTVTLRVSRMTMLDCSGLRDLDYKISFLIMHVEGDEVVFDIGVNYFAVNGGFRRLY